jgi:hypothetical protein
VRRSVSGDAVRQKFRLSRTVTAQMTATIFGLSDADLAALAHYAASH